MSFDDPQLVDVPYTFDDVEEIERVRGKPYPRLRATVRALNETTLSCNINGKNFEDAMGEVWMLKLTKAKLSQLVDYQDLELKDAEEDKDKLRKERDSYKSSVEAYSQKVALLESLNQRFRNVDAETIAELRKNLERVVNSLSQSRPDVGSPSDDERQMWHERNESLIAARKVL